MKHLGAAFFSMAILSSCASGGSGTSSPVPESEPHLSPVTVTGPVTIALRTVGQLVEAGNEQKAIDRLTQLLGRPDLTDQERGRRFISERSFDAEPGMMLRERCRILTYY